MIRQRFRVVGTSGNEFVCRCPFHNDQGKPNLYINGVSGLYLCHSCGAKGSLLKKGEALPATDTRHVRERLQKMTKADEREQFKPEGWLKQFDFPHDGWKHRGLSDDIIKQFGLGYDPFRNVLTVPLRNDEGRLQGVISRRLDDQKPKYLYPKGYKTGKHLFGAWLLQDQTTVALVEGSVDAMACWDARVPALALLGSRMTPDQRKVLQKKAIRKVVIMTDNDSAGQTAVVQIKDMLDGSGIAVYVGWYRSYWHNCKDPADLKPDRRRKMFHGSLPFHRWVERLVL